MGVIDRKNLDKPSTETNNIPQSDEDVLSIPEELSEPEVSFANDALQLVHVQRRIRRKPVQSLAAPSKPGKHCGKRRLRHFRAVEDLRIMWHDSEDTIELSIHDFMHIKPSPFAILLQDSILLKAWWEFISKPDDDKQLVKYIDEKVVVTRDPSPPKPPEYRKIEQHLKELLQRQSMDIAMVAEIELQLVDFFQNTPKEVLKLKRLTRYESMINQATCQYHGLQSQLGEASKKRNDLLISLIEDKYSQPETPLHNYLEQRQQFYNKVAS